MWLCSCLFYCPVHPQHSIRGQSLMPCKGAEPCKRWPGITLCVLWGGNEAPTVELLCLLCTYLEHPI